MGTDTPIAVLSDRPAPAVRLLPAALRPGHQPAARRHPRGAGHRARLHHRPRGQPARPGPGVVPPARPAVPDHRQRRAGQARPRQRRRRPRPASHAVTISGLYRVAGGGLALRGRSTPIGAEVSQAIADGARIIVLSDRNADEALAPIPSLLLTSAVHHHLIREKTAHQGRPRRRGGDAREVHHMALLIGYGAGAINPYLAFESHRGHDRRGPARPRRPRSRRPPSTTTSRPPARACSR